MTVTKNLGVWMDHSRANIISFADGTASTVKAIEAGFSHEVKQESLSKGEHLMHNKEQQMQAAYYKEVAAEILKYGDVLLFGPTNAKHELHNLLLADPAYAGISIAVKGADKMNENQQHAFVREHFAGK